MEPPGTYSRKIERNSGVCSMPVVVKRKGKRFSVVSSEKGKERKRERTEVQHDIGVIQILQQLNLRLQARNHPLRPLIFLVRERPGHLNLFDRDRLTRRDAESDVDVPVRSATDEVSFDPFVGNCKRGRGQYRGKGNKKGRKREGENVQFSGSSTDVSFSELIPFICALVTSSILAPNNLVLLLLNKLLASPLAAEATFLPAF
jgi:hypothetical protein